MGKPNLVIDRNYLIGNSKVVRKHSWPGSAEMATGDAFAAHHPSLKRFYQARMPPLSQVTQADPFRAAGARYWGFQKGATKTTWRNFGYLNKTSYDLGGDVERLNINNESEFISFKFKNDSPTDEVHYDTGIGPLGDVLDCDSGMAAAGVAFWLGYPLAGPEGAYASGHAGMPSTWAGQGDGMGGPSWENSGFTDPASAGGVARINLSRLSRITIWGDNAAWVAGSMAHGVGINSTDSIYELRDALNGPHDNWRQYVEGGFSNYGGFRGILGSQFTANSPIFTTMFFDHAHQFYSPYATDAPILNLGAPVSVKTAKISANYNFFIKKYENAIAGLDERVLPNAYILFNAIDYGPLAEEVDSQLGSEMLSIYNKVSCLWDPSAGSFALPTSRDQVKNVGYCPETVESPLYNKSYLQKYYSIDTSNIDFTYIKSRTSHIGFSKAMMEEDFVEYSDGISGEYFDPTGQLDTNKADIYMPYDITIEFDSLMPGYDSSNKFIKLFEEVEGAYDFILQNIMTMNIKTNLSWTSLANQATITDPLLIAGKQIYDSTWPFSGLITDYDEGASYYGFDWVTGDNSAWGTTHVAGESGAENAHNKGPYNLHTADLAMMMGFSWGIRNYNAVQPVTLADAPSPLVGQTRDNGVAFGQGLLVGRKKIATNSTWTKHYQAWPPAGAPPVLSENSFIQLIKGLADVIREKSRTYLEMINGELAYNETIAYRVDKYVVSQGMERLPAGAKPIQSFYFPNLRALGKIRYVDTQVKYAQKYIYKVYAYNIVVGDQYHYKNNVNEANPTSIIYGSALGARFYVHQFPSVKLIEAPYCEYGPIEVRDLPPVFPEIEMVPFQGVNNKLRILMQTQNVKYAFNPDKFIIAEEDTANYELQRGYQQRPTGPIVFGSDDTELSFEIYRTTTKPTSYRDFEGQLLTTLEGCVPGGLRAVNIAYDDTIEPNQKYYYTFRCIDYHNSISIPSPIYVAEIVDDNGRMFPLIDVFYISNHVDSIKKTCKPLRRYLKIGAALAQSVIPEDRLDALAGSPSLDPEVSPPPGLLGTVGTPNDIWSNPLAGDKKVFKIRLTSRHTGKKIDLNIQFKETPITNPSGEDESSC